MDLAGLGINSAGLATDLAGLALCARVTAEGLMTEPRPTVEEGRGDGSWPTGC